MSRPLLAQPRMVRVWGSTMTSVPAHYTGGPLWYPLISSGAAPMPSVQPMKHPT